MRISDLDIADFKVPKDHIVLDFPGHNRGRRVCNQNHLSFEEVLSPNVPLDLEKVELVLRQNLLQLLHLVKHDIFSLHKLGFVALANFLIGQLHELDVIVGLESDVDTQRDPSFALVTHQQNKVILIFLKQRIHAVLHGFELLQFRVMPLVSFKLHPHLLISEDVRRATLILAGLFHLVSGKLRSYISSFLVDIALDECIFPFSPQTLREDRFLSFFINLSHFLVYLVQKSRDPLQC